MSDEATVYGSVTVWLQLLKAGDKREAVAQLWASYFGRMVALARDHLRARRGACDEEDLALSAFDTFVRATQAGRFPRLDDRDDLWQVLLMLTARKTADAVAKNATLKAGGGRLVHLSALRPTGEGSSDVFDPPVGDPGPAEVVAMAEGLQELLRTLRDDDLKRVVVWRMEGHTNEEVAHRLGRSVASVERKLQAARAILRDAGYHGSD